MRVYRNPAPRLHGDVRLVVKSAVCEAVKMGSNPIHHPIAESSKGKTQDFGPCYLGSNPSSAAKAYSPSGCWDYADNVVALSSILK